MSCGRLVVPVVAPPRDTDACHSHSGSMKPKAGFSHAPKSSPLLTAEKFSNSFEAASLWCEPSGSEGWRCWAAPGTLGWPLGTWCWCLRLLSAPPGAHGRCGRGRNALFLFSIPLGKGGRSLGMLLGFSLERQGGLCALFYFCLLSWEERLRMTAKRDRMPKEEKHPEKMTSYIFIYFFWLISSIFVSVLKYRRKKIKQI